MSYENFARMTETLPAPDESWLVVADVRGSTVAVSEGRYREVNLIGAACVAAMRNHFETRRLPYVFGGDGATFLVAASDLERCLELLLQVQLLARDSFGLQLGVGQMQIKAVRQLGGDVRYGFLNWGPTEVLPFFRGKGVALAEKQIKQQMQDVPLGLSSQSAAPVIEGLSCRILPFAALRGRVLSVIVEPTVAAAAEDAVFAQIFAVFKRRGDIERLRPVSMANTRRRWLDRGFVKEALLHRRSTRLGSTWRAYVAALVAAWVTTALFRFKWKTQTIGDVDTYNQHMLQQSDWMKMDGVLRMVIDANAAEESELRLVLGGLEARGEVVFGLFASATALMTCHFQSSVGQKHAHFIDGADGGLTLAAKALKEKKVRLAAAEDQIVEKPA